MFDFLLVSQKVRQGTVTPVHYNVIFDNTNFDPDKHQEHFQTFNNSIVSHILIINYIINYN